MKRRKDSGFTLIELMIVIAVIGILAIVLIPRVGTVKEQAKNAGLETNLKVVQGFVESRISYWDDQGSGVDDIGKNIIDAFSPAGKLKNPHNSNDTASGTDAVGGDTDSIVADDALLVYATSDTFDSTNAQGSIVVQIPASLDTGIVITGYDANGNEFNTAIVKP